MFAIGSLFFIRSWTLGVRCSMFNLFNVGRSSFKPTPYGINATCECLQNNLALMHPIPGSKAVSISYTGCHKYVPYWTLSTTRRRHNKLPLSERYFDKRSRRQEEMNLLKRNVIILGGLNRGTLRIRSRCTTCRSIPGAGIPSAKELNISCNYFGGIPFVAIPVFP